MANNVNRFGNVKRGDPRAVAAFMGWHDARLGLPMRPEFMDHWDRGIAAAYHNYRLLLLEARRVGVRLPGWKASSQIPPAIKALRTALAEVSVAEDRPTATLLSGALTTRRPEHLVKADLAADLAAKGLASLAPQDVASVY
jgi:hypothetical protein